MTDGAPQGSTRSTTAHVGSWASCGRASPWPVHGRIPISPPPHAQPSPQLPLPLPSPTSTWPAPSGLCPHPDRQQLPSVLALVDSFWDPPGSCSSSIRSGFDSALHARVIAPRFAVGRLYRKSRTRTKAMMPSPLEAPEAVDFSRPTPPSSPSYAVPRTCRHKNILNNRDSDGAIDHR
jgi:hypothetical protein